MFVHRREPDRPERRARRRARIVGAAAAAGLILISVPAARAAPGNPQYPDLRTLPPHDLRFDTVPIDGVMRPVLRFSNEAWNAGAGPLHLVAKTDRQSKKSHVVQRIYSNATATGQYDQRHVGDFVFHIAHDHFHFEAFAEYQLWPATAWDSWVAEGRPTGTERSSLRGQGVKTTFCIMDTDRVRGDLPGSPVTATYNTCGRTVQGMSVGWGDSYGYYLPDQWVVLDAGLADGTYVLRSITDPLNVLYESSNRGDPAVESRTANEAITRFAVAGGTVQITSP